MNKIKDYTYIFQKASLLEEAQELCLLERNMKWVQHMSPGTEKLHNHPGPCQLLNMCNVTEYPNLTHWPVPVKRGQLAEISKKIFPWRLQVQYLGSRPSSHVLSLRGKKKKYEKWKTRVERFVFLNIGNVFISSPMTLSWTTFNMSSLGLMLWLVLHPVCLVNTVKIELS